MTDKWNGSTLKQFASPLDHQGAQQMEEIRRQFSKLPLPLATT